MSVEESLIARLRGMTKTARMWGSPAELECAALHFSHVLWAQRAPEWTLANTQQRWASAGGPFAQDEAAHAAMRAKLYGGEEERARVQVVQGFVVVWASLAREPAREAAAGTWVETLLDTPQLAGAPEQLNMALFALMGFVAADAQAYVQALSVERHRVGGHELRPLAVVAPPGPADVAATYAGSFQSWGRVIDGISQVMERSGF